MQSLRCNLDLGQISLPGAQLQNTGRPGIHTKSQQVDITTSIIGLEKYGDKKGQKGIKDLIPQLDGTYNEKDTSDSDLHEYLDLA